MFCWSLFVLLYFFFWPLCCLFFFNSSSIYRFWLPLWYLLAIVLSVLQYTDSDYLPLVSSNSSCTWTIQYISSQLCCCLKIFKDPVPMLMVLGYLSHVKSYVCLHWLMVFNFEQYFSYIVAVSFIGWGNRRTRRKPLTCRKSLTNFIT